MVWWRDFASGEMLDNSGLGHIAELAHRWRAIANGEMEDNKRRSREVRLTALHYLRLH